MDALHSLVSNSRVFQEDCAARFVNVRIVDSRDDITSSNFLTARSRLLYIWDITVCEVIISPKCILFLSNNVSKVALAAQTQSISTHDEVGFYISAEKDISFIIWAANMFVEKGHNPVPFRANAF